MQPILIRPFYETSALNLGIERGVGTRLRRIALTARCLCIAGLVDGDLNYEHLLAVSSAMIAGVPTSNNWDVHRRAPDIDITTSEHSAEEPGVGRSALLGDLVAAVELRISTSGGSLGDGVVAFDLARVAGAATGVLTGISNILVTSAVATRGGNLAGKGCGRGRRPWDSCRLGSRNGEASVGCAPVGCAPVGCASIGRAVTLGGDGQRPGARNREASAG